MKDCFLIIVLTCWTCVGVCSADPLTEETKQVVHGASGCIAREAQTKTLAKLDLDTAAYAVIAKCAQEIAAWREFSRNHWPLSQSEFEAWWRNNESDNLNFAKQAVALVRAEKAGK